jgi:hypothetical protein
MANSKDYRNGKSLVLDAVQTFGGDVRDIDPALRAGKRERIEMIALDDITPDARQPRRAVPGLVMRSAREWQADVFIAWQMLTENEMAGEFRIHDVFFAEGDPDEAEYGVMGRMLVEMINLARSIRKDGLINPITLYAQGERYIVETGERRWWAYQLLRALEGEHQWAKIPARIVSQPDVWRQASENGARAQLTAIARARQYALLMMALYPDAQFAPYDPLHDRAYYAQVAALRVPRGRAQDIMAAMGVTSRSNLVQYRDLLLIDDVTWTQADDEAWSIRELFSALNNSDGADGGAADAPLRVPTASDISQTAQKSDADNSQNYSGADSPTREDGGMWAENGSELHTISANITESSSKEVQLSLWNQVDWSGWRKRNQRWANASRGRLTMSRDELLADIEAQRRLLDALERKARGE